MLTSNKAQITLVWGYEKFLPSDFKLPDFPWAFPDIHGICLANPPPSKKKKPQEKSWIPKFSQQQTQIKKQTECIIT